MLCSCSRDTHVQFVRKKEEEKKIKTQGHKFPTTVEYDVRCNECSLIALDVVKIVLTVAAVKKCAEYGLCTEPYWLFAEDSFVFQNPV